MDALITKDFVIEDKKSLSEILIENREYIYPALFYIAGLILGSFCYSVINHSIINKIIKAIFESSATSFDSIFLNRFCIYFSVFTITVLLGMCLIGFPFINIIPLMVGTELAIKTAYYYVNYSVKGIGFSLLMIIPEGAAFATVLIYTIKISSSLSKNIYALTAGKENDSQIDIKAYLKKYLIYAAAVTLIALLNAVSAFLLNGIIHL